MNKLLTIPAIFFILCSFNESIFAVISSKKDSSTAYKQSNVSYSHLESNDTSTKENKHKKLHQPWCTPSSTAIAKGLTAAIIIGCVGYSAYWSLKKENKEPYLSLPSNITSNLEFHRWVNNTTLSSLSGSTTDIIINNTPNNTNGSTDNGTTDATINSTPNSIANNISSITTSSTTNINTTNSDNIAECSVENDKQDSPHSCFFVVDDVGGGRHKSSHRKW